MASRDENPKRTWPPHSDNPNFLSKGTTCTKQTFRLLQTIPKLTIHDYKSGPCRILAASRCTSKFAQCWYQSAVSDNWTRPNYPLRDFYMLAPTACYFNGNFHIVPQTVYGADYHENVLKRWHFSHAKVTKRTIFGSFLKLRISTRKTIQ